MELGLAAGKACVLTSVLSLFSPFIALCADPIQSRICTKSSWHALLVLLFKSGRTSFHTCFCFFQLAVAFLMSSGSCPLCATLFELIYLLPYEYFLHCIISGIQNSNLSHYAKIIHLLKYLKNKILGFALGTILGVLRPYPWLCTQGSLVEVLSGLYGCHR